MLFGSSVELFVYLAEGCGMTRTQINNTPHLYDMLRNKHINTSDECCCSPCVLENYHIFCQG